MEELEDFGRDIAYSRSVKAGKRLYYLDVKRNRNGELYISLTEIKKKTSGSPENPEITFEKHKIFLYREDLSKFTEALIDVIRFIKDHESDTNIDRTTLQPTDKKRHEPLFEPSEESDIDDDVFPIKLDLTDFE